MTIEKRIDTILKAIKEEKAGEEDELLLLYDSTFSARQLQRKGKALANNTIHSIRSGLFGRVIFTCGPNHGGELPKVDLGHGDPVMVRHSDRKFSGFIFSQTELTLDICVDMEDESEKGDLVGIKVDILPSANDITYRRMKKCAEELRKLTEPSQLIEVLLGQTKPSPQIVNERFRTFKTAPQRMAHLNPEQREAVNLSIALPELFCLHGPPGTGKTTTIAAIAVEHVERGTKVIVTCPSNAAVDVLVEKLARSKVKVTRLGHPARTSAHLRNYTLDAKMDEIEMLKDLKKEMYAAKGKDRGLLRKELRSREAKCAKDLLSTSDVIIATCTVVGSGSILDLIDEKNFFGLAIVDEAGQAMEPAIYPIICRCSSKLILAGDPCQLPPTIISKNVRLSHTLLEDAMKRHSGNVLKLKRQYRMNKLISDWVSVSMYNGELIADPSCENHTLDQIACKPPFNELMADFIKNPLNLIDTVGTDMSEDDSEDDQSKSNPGEATIVAMLVELLRKSGIPDGNIAVISPYAAQVQLITSLIPKTISCRSVDGYQGGEAEVVIISMVRSNTDGTTGFLSDNRRLNVAVSRARRCCCIVGDTGTITKQPFIERMVEYFCQHANLISPSQFEMLDEWEDMAKRAGFIAANNKAFHDHFEPKTEESFEKLSLSKKAAVAPPPPSQGASKKKQPKSKLEKKLEKSVNEKAEKEAVPAAVTVEVAHESTAPSLSKPFAALPVAAVEMVSCCDCKKKLPAGNLELHQIHCKRLQKGKQEAMVEPIVVKKKKAKQNKPRLNKNPANKDFDKYDDDDALLEAAMATAGHCAFGTCSISVRVLGFPCNSCSKHFCSTHKFPESHGCRAIPASKGLSTGRTKEMRHKVLKNKMKEKLTTMEKSRETKDKDEPKRKVTVESSGRKRK